MLKKFKKVIKNWWYQKECLFNISFQISASRISINFMILEYGLGACFELPEIIPYYFKVLYYREQSITKNKFFSEQFSFFSDLSTGFNCSWFIHRHHAGLNIDFSLFGLEYAYKILDIRHWKYLDNKYESY